MRRDEDPVELDRILGEGGAALVDDLLHRLGQANGLIETSLTWKDRALDARRELKRLSDGWLDAAKDAPTVNGYYIGWDSKNKQAREVYCDVDAYFSRYEWPWSDRNGDPVPYITKWQPFPLGPDALKGGAE